MNANFLSPKVRVRADHDGWRSSAFLPISAGETVAAFGGPCVTSATLAALPVYDRANSVQIDDHLFLVSDHLSLVSDRQEPALPGDMISHSCAPNCGMAGGVLVVAMRDIAAGESVSFDDAMWMGSSEHEFECTCGTSTCRRKVTGRDWMLPELQVAYRGHFSPYLAKRIAALVSTGAERRAFAL